MSTRLQQAIFTGRNEVVAKVMFLQVSVILSTRGGSPENPPPRTKENPPRTRQTPPRIKETPPREEDCSIRSMSGRYASYWNAILSLHRFSRCKQDPGSRYHYYLSHLEIQLKHFTSPNLPQL